ncbi:hypothetical protein CLOSTASPAR_02558 [[Clostridium] asparagiforme DSM 15981]|uniref:Uncharacterized protein n=1 Tax=[Clostridium] asparagiforme DSM 15981 TaxID=518636 RepID=C0CZX7_9FIRM|nr:hypothetical protein CLOSTASPAR_02558 [[Clostridium] asparagiforme DSM 15981]
MLSTFLPLLCVYFFDGFSIAQELVYEKYIFVLLGYRENADDWWRVFCGVLIVYWGAYWDALGGALRHFGGALAAHWGALVAYWRRIGALWRLIAR